MSEPRAAPLVGVIGVGLGLRVFAAGHTGNGTPHGELSASRSRSRLRGPRRPHRRAIPARLEQAESLTISAIAEPFAIKLPAVMKHLDVLGDAGLITREKHGRTVDVRLAPEPLREATEWLRRYERFWSTALDRLTAYAERNEAEAKARGE
jgi:DNA-binding transcriptional ArsR family regulator